jgi:hypothetical protein
MTTPSRPEADMLHMQHAQMIQVIVRQHEAARLAAERDVAAEARRIATPEPAPASRVRKVRAYGPRPA